MSFILFYYVFQIFKKMSCKLIKLSYIGELIYNVFTWFDWSMALMEFQISYNNILFIEARNSWEITSFA